MVQLHYETSPQSTSARPLAHRRCAASVRGQALVLGGRRLARPGTGGLGGGRRRGAAAAREQGERAGALVVARVHRWEGWAEHFVFALSRDLGRRLIMCRPRGCRWSFSSPFPRQSLPQGRHFLGSGRPQSPPLLQCPDMAIPGAALRSKSFARLRSGRLMTRWPQNRHGLYWSVMWHHLATPDNNCKQASCHARQRVGVEEPCERRTIDFLVFGDP